MTSMITSLQNAADLASLSMFSQFVGFLLDCLPRGRHSEAAHEKRLLCAQKCTRGGVGWGGWVMKGWGGVGHEGVGWGGVGHEGVGWVM